MVVARHICMGTIISSSLMLAFKLSMLLNARKPCRKIQFSQLSCMHGARSFLYPNINLLTATFSTKSAISSPIAQE